MKIQKTTLLFLLVLFSSFLFSQTKTAKQLPSKPTALAKVACDCKDAIKINIQKETRYGLTVAPNSFGTLQEITQTNKFDKYNFEKEHHSAWYVLNINVDGDFVFEIHPVDSTNDYDFLLYKYTDTNFCNDVKKHKLKTVRSNLSRGNPTLKGYTGLSLNSKNEFQGQGICDAYSKSIEVKKGEKYILVLDNVYPLGKGHTIFFNYEKQVTISGVVMNGDSVPVKAEVTLSDNDGNIVRTIQTTEDGKYEMYETLKAYVNYSLSYNSEDGFYDVRFINIENLKDNHSFTDIRTVLPKLKKGGKYKMGSIIFFGNSPDLKPESIPSLEALLKLMKKNKKMIIEIEGYVNGAGSLNSTIKSFEHLSEERAKTVYSFLLNKGIEKERMSTIGYGAKNMLYPKAKNEAEQEANRRVEINVISIE